MGRRILAGHWRMFDAQSKLSKIISFADPAGTDGASVINVLMRDSRARAKLTPLIANVAT